MNLTPNFDSSTSQFSQYVREGNYDLIRSFLSENKDLNVLFLNQALIHSFHCFNPNSGHFQIIKELINKGANLNAQDSHGITPLMTVCFKGNMNLMKFLLDKKVNINIRDENKANALYYAIDNETVYEMYDICQMLVNNGSDINIETINGSTPLWRAIERQQVGVVQLLCEQDLSVNVANKLTGDTPLHLAVRMKNRQIIRILMEKFARTDKRNKKNLTPYDLMKEDADLLDFLRKLEVTQKNSEQNAINISLGNNNKNTETGFKSNNPTRKQLTLKNYHISPPATFLECLKSEKSESNSETLNQFELEIPSQQQNSPFIGKKFPQYGSNYSLGQQAPDHILNHLGPNPCFSPPLLNNQMNPLHNSYSENSFNQHQSQNPRFNQKNPKKKFQQKDNNNISYNKKPSGFQQQLSTPNYNNNNNNNNNNNINNNYNRNYNYSNSSYDSNNKFFPNNNNNFPQNFNNNYNSTGGFMPKQMTQISGFSQNENDSSSMNFSQNNLKSEELKTLEIENEELKAEIEALENELNGSKGRENIEGILENENSKAINTDLSINDSQRSYYLENCSLEKKVLLYLPTELVAGDLHKEIMEFESLVSKFQTESQQKFQNFIPTLKSYIQEITKIEPEISVYGSYESGLALPYSDIDVAVNLNLKMNGLIDEMLIQSICENLKRKEAIAELKKFYGSASHPTQTINQIKIDASFPKEKFDRRVNLTFVDFGKFAGLKYVKLMKHYLKEIKSLRYLALIIKEFIFQSKLSLANMTKGGMNSYSLILMIIAFLQQKANAESLDLKQPIESPMLGNLLIEFFYHYGFDVDFIFKEIIVNLPENLNDEKAHQQPQTSLIEPGEPAPKLIIGDPLKRHINVGRSAPIMKIKGAFSLAYMVLHQNFKSNACFSQGEEKGDENRKMECCRILERLFTCTHHTGFFRKMNQL